MNREDLIKRVLATVVFCVVFAGVIAMTARKQPKEPALTSEEIEKRTEASHARNEKKLQEQLAESETRAIEAKRMADEAKRKAEIAAGFNELAKQYSGVSFPAVSSTERPVKRGKLMFVDGGKYRTPDYLPPSDLWNAATPGDVRTVVVLKSSSREVGRYTNGAIAFQDTINVRVIDISLKKEIAVRDIAGLPPPSAVMAGGGAGGWHPGVEVHGAMPKAEILAFVMSALDQAAKRAEQ